MDTILFEKEGGSNKFFAAALGIMFSVNKHTANLAGDEMDIINKFFDSLQWDVIEGSPVVDKLAYGDLMNMVDFNNRWVYSGSTTTPPCTTEVFWNNLSTVYPISEKHVK